MGPVDAIVALGRPELRPLWETARRRLERNGRTLTNNPIQLTGLTDAEVASICMLLCRRRPPNNSVRVSLADLDATLRASSLGFGLIETLEALAGPVTDRRAERAHARDRLAELWRAADAHPASRSDAVAQWLVSVRRRGRLTRLAVDDPAALLTTALDCLERLVADGEAHRADPLPLAAVAATLLGDAHALDPETSLGAIAGDAVSTLSGSTDLRSAWLSFGIQLDSISASALSYMLPGQPGSILHAARAASEPLRVTGRMLDRGVDFDIQPGDVVWVCENPSIVTIAANRLGSGSGPLVCLEGMPSTVTNELLSELRQLGAELRAHADFDFGGIAIMNHVASRHGAEPWRMSCTDYIAALERPTTGLDHPIGPTAWDPQLSTVMNTYRRAVHEEAIAEVLLADLSQ
jgi:uncharacterized protein (TIGR02679 family)